MEGKVYGYARVSTKNQNEDRQVIALQGYGIEKSRIMVEKQSGKDFNRPVYKRLLKKMKAGDTLVITSLDRLGRDYTEVQEQWRIINKERGISIVVLDMPLLNTKETTELIGRLISDLVLGIFSFVAQTERESIRARQREGIEAAKARGVRFGRPRLSVPEDFEELAKRWRRGEFTSEEAARNLGFSRSTFFRRVNEVEAQMKALPDSDLSCAELQDEGKMREEQTELEEKGDHGTSPDCEVNTEKQDENTSIDSIGQAPESSALSSSETQPADDREAVSGSSCESASANRDDTFSEPGNADSLRMPTDTKFAAKGNDSSNAACHSCAFDRSSLPRPAEDN